MLVDSIYVRVIVWSTVEASLPYTHCFRSKYMNKRLIVNDDAT